MEKLEIVPEVKEIELPYKIKLSGNLDSFAWETEYTTDELKEVESISLELSYEDSDTVDHIKCIMYRDNEYNLHVEVKCSVSIRKQHLNHLIQTLVSTIRIASVENDELIVTNKHNDYKSLTYLVDALGMVHTITNIINE